MNQPMLPSCIDVVVIFGPGIDDPPDDPKDTEAVPKSSLSVLFNTEMG